MVTRAPRRYHPFAHMLMSLYLWRQIHEDLAPHRRSHRIRYRRTRSFFSPIRCGFQALAQVAAIATWNF